MSRHLVIAGKARHLSGWKKDRPDHRDFKLVRPTAVPLPPAVPKLAGLPPVFDQGGIGSCTANMGCEQMEFLEHQGAADKIFSRLYLYARTRQLEGTPLAEDAGAEIRDVMTTLAQRGVCYEPSWPYDESKFMVDPPQSADIEAQAHKAVFYYRCPDVMTLKASLTQGFPVGFGFSVPNNMMSDECARTGLVMFPSPSEGFDGGHAVTAVGYDDAMKIGTEVGAILCMNHWSEQWGQAGFFWLPYRFWTEALADDCWSLRQAQV